MEDIDVESAAVLAIAEAYLAEAEQRVAALRADGNADAIALAVGHLEACLEMLRQCETQTRHGNPRAAERR